MAACADLTARASNLSKYALLVWPHRQGCSPHHLLLIDSGRYFSCHFLQETVDSGNIPIGKEDMFKFKTWKWGTSRINSTKKQHNFMNIIKNSTFSSIMKNLKEVFPLFPVRFDNFLREMPMRCRFPPSDIKCIFNKCFLYAYICHMNRCNVSVPHPVISPVWCGVVVVVVVVFFTDNNTSLGWIRLT